MLEVRNSRVESIQVRVQRKVAQGLPGGFVALDFHWIHAQGGVVADGGGGDHGDAVEASVT